MQNNANDLVRSFRAKATGTMVTYRAVVWRKGTPMQYFASHGENTLEAAIKAGQLNGYRDLKKFKVEVFREVYVPNHNGSAFIIESATSVWSSER